MTTQPFNTDPMSNADLQDAGNQQLHKPSAFKAVLWLVLIAIIFYSAAILPIVGYSGYLAATQPELLQDQELLESLVLDMAMTPVFNAWVMVLQFALLVPLVLLIANFAQQSWRQTLAFRSISLKVLGLGLAVYAVYFAVQSGINHIWPMDLGLLEGFANSQHLGLLLAMVFLAPVTEELIFRGYLFKAWRHTWLGAHGTILLTSVLFTLVHASQYPLLTLAILFTFSLILGYAREKTGSIWLPIILHMLNNLIGGLALLYFFS